MGPVHWAKTDAGNWYSFETCNLFYARGSGVYVIWYDAAKPESVCVGHGVIATRIAERRTDRGVLMYRELGPLYVTWAELPHGMQQGAARYLTEKLQPPFGDTLMLIPPIEIDLPEFTQRLERV